MENSQERDRKRRKRVNQDTEMVGWSKCLMVLLRGVEKTGKEEIGEEGKRRDVLRKKEQKVNNL